MLTAQNFGHFALPFSRFMHQTRLFFHHPIVPQEQCYEVPFKACRNVKTKGRPIGNPNCKTSVETRLESVVKDIKNQDTKIQESVKDDTKTSSFGGAIKFGS